MPIVCAMRSTVKVAFLTGQKGVCLIRLKVKQPIAEFIFIQKQKQLMPVNI